MKINIRQANSEDTPLILSFIQALADYERLSHEVVATEEDLKRTLFGQEKGAEVVLAFADGEPAGFCLFFHNYSTFLARRGIYIEDLFVKPELRGLGIGKRLLTHVAALAVERGCGRLEWSVLDWNVPAIQFYKSLGAKPMDEWTVFRLTGNDLNRIGSMAQSTCEV